MRPEKIAPARAPVRCRCGHPLFDGLVIRARVVRVLPRGAEAKCSRCKTWHPVPITYSPLA